MSVLAYPVGVDISCDTFDAFLLRLNADRSCKAMGKRNFKNTLAGYKQFMRWLTAKVDDMELVHIGMEATGRYYENLAYYLVEASVCRSVSLPNKIKSFAHSLNEFSKNDPLDAKLIAQYVAMHTPPSWTPISPMMRHLRELSRERQSLINMRTMAKNRLHALSSGYQPFKDSVSRLKQQVKFYDKQIGSIELEMDQLRDGDKSLKISHDLLVSIPYIGSVTAYTILAETDGFLLFDNREQLIKYAGLDIIEKQSGRTVQGRSRISKRGNAHLRSAPYPGLASVGASNSVFGDTYRAALERGLVNKQARTAVVRQLLRVAFGVHKSGVPYSDETHRNRGQKKIGELEGSPTVTDLVS